MPVAVDDEQALAVRLRAAVLCRRAGDRVDHAGLFRAAATDEDLDSAIFAALYLPWFVDGEDAIAPLAAALARLDEPLEPRAHLRAFLPASRRLPGFVAAFRAQGEPGLARLRELLESGDVSPTARISLCVIWWQLGQSGLPDGLRTMICSGDPVDANLALNAMIYSEPEDLTGILLGLARDGTADDVRLAMYFDDHPHPDAVAPLERMLAEPREDREARWIRQALDACRR